VLVKAATVVGSIAGSGFAMMASSPLAFLILSANHVGGYCTVHCYVKYLYLKITCAYCTGTVVSSILAHKIDWNLPSPPDQPPTVKPYRWPHAEYVNVPPPVMLRHLWHQFASSFGTAAGNVATV
jgi:hypothetical protein